MPAQSNLLWRIPQGQRLIFEDFDDAIVMYDALVGATHLINVTAAEALAVIQESPGLAVEDIHRRLLERLAIDERALPHAAVEELLWHLEDLDLVSAFAP